MATKNNTAFQRAITRHEVQKRFPGQKLHPQVLELIRLGAVARDALVEHDVAEIEGTEVDSTEGKDLANGKEVKSRSIYRDSNGAHKFVLDGRSLKSKTGDFILRVYNEFASEVVDFDVPLKYLRKLEGKDGICFSWSNKNGYNRLNQFVSRRQEFTAVD